MRERERERERDKRVMVYTQEEVEKKKMKGGARKGVGGIGPRKWSVDVSILSFVKERL
jgi:hypothetical protein